jgi:hypothetical protein
MGLLAGVDRAAAIGAVAGKDDIGGTNGVPVQVED